ncbi:hypothetical protein [Kordiimonas pumila]|uniref:Uncharacterized protein n=1 Tax=Kordiimonas pumila TaxID=2161677 RepID=A0ABV7D3G0_9PROT|nr:hypothetical protein [Kordiimonas pumila]
MPHRVCIISDPACPAASDAAYAALTHEKSVQLIDLPSGGTEATNSMVAAKEMLSSDMADYLLPATIEMAQILLSARISPARLITAHGLSAKTKAPHSHTVAYTQQDGHLTFAADTPWAAGNGPFIISQTSAAYRQAIRANQRYHPIGGWVYADRAVTGISPSAATLLRQFGVNVWALALFEKAGHPVSVIQQNIAGTLTSNDTAPQFQAPVSHLYLDMDDTLYVHGRLNPHVTRLIAACQRICPISLITRHFQQPEITLAQYGIATSLFHEILWITDGSPKSNHINKGPDVVFIDDSYKERLDVRNSLGIIVLPPDIAEILQPITAS